MTRKQAIEQKCKNCIYDDCEPGTWRQQVEACIDRTCALYPYRATSRGVKLDENGGKK